ncbi:MAG TPA: HAMP domain-containing sensor histidine kinase [Acidobacteriaceae bacterium]|nr:HAMP domain-containing sensor histidine kinase [Acidobacteriaceae bacterium]
MSQKTMLEQLRMRTTLLVPLLFVSFAWTVFSLLILRNLVRQQTHSDLVSALQHSVTTYKNLQRQRSNMLRRESALLADLPTLKALMTSHDRRTIEDGGAEFWKTSGADLFVLLDSQGHLGAAYRNGGNLRNDVVERSLGEHLRDTRAPFYMELEGTLYEIAVQPLIFGERNSGTALGYVAAGYAVDRNVAEQVSEAAAAEVAFASGGKIIAATLPPVIQGQLETLLGKKPGAIKEATIALDGQQYLTTAVPLDDAGNAQGLPELIVLKSFREGDERLSRVNHWVESLGLLALLAGGTILLAISRSITRPLANLVDGARALGKGDYTYRLSDDGAEEVRELSRAFERMRVEIQRTQKDLLNSERLATIGRMASSISHDLRHYLSAMYANAEFMCDGKLGQEEREELLTEVQEAVQGMTELLDSLLLFTRTGRALHPEFESIALILQRAAGLLRAHPTARDVKISMQGLSSLIAYVDGKKLGRAVYNLLLNGCQAAKRGQGPAAVTLTLAEDESFIRIHVSDTGPGVSDTVRRTMFLPFVSEGKENGVGLGLTLAEQIAAEHGGYIHYGKAADSLTLFSIVLPKNALQPPSRPSSTVSTSVTEEVS